MTNREKAITDLTKWLKTLDNRRLANVVMYTYNGDFICHRCIHNVDYERTHRDSYELTRRDWSCRAKGTCADGVKQWLEQEES